MNRLKNRISAHFDVILIGLMGGLFVLLFAWVGMEKLQLETAHRSVVLLASASSLGGATGQMRGVARIAQKGDAPGIFAFTPYMRLAKGYYRCLFQYRSDKNVKWGIFADRGREEINRGHFFRSTKHFRTGLVDFVVPDALTNRILEVRLWYSGQGKIEVRGAEVFHLDTPFVDGYRLPLLLLILPILLLLFVVFVRGMTVHKNKRFETWAVGLVVLALGFVLLPSIYEAFIFLAVIMVTLWWVRSGRIPVFQVSDFVLLAFIGLTFISALFSKDIVRSISGSLVFVLYFWIYQVFRSLPWSSKSSKLLLRIVAIGLMGWSAFSLFHGLILDHFLNLTFFGKTLLSFEANQAHEILISFFQYGSMGAYLMVLGSVFLLSGLLNRFGKLLIWEKCLGIVALLFVSLSVYFTGGRGAMLFLMISLGTFILANRKFRFVAVLAVGAIALFFAPQAKIRNTMRNLTNPSKILNLGGRLNQYQMAVKLFLRKPLTGVGLLQFSPAYQKENPIAYEADPVEFVHGLYLGLLCETGVLGFGSFLLFLALLGFKWIRQWLRGKESDHPAQWQGLAVLFGLLLISFFDALLYNIPLGVLIWMHLGLAENPSYLQVGQKEEGGE